MPGVISASDFIRETREDLSSPTTSNFVSRIPQCKETVQKLEEVGTWKKSTHNALHCQCQPKAFKSSVTWSKCNATNACNLSIGTVLLGKTWTHVTYECKTESLLGWQWIKSAVWPPWLSYLHARADIALSDNTSCTNTLPNRSSAGSSNILWHDRTRTYWVWCDFYVSVSLWWSPQGKRNLINAAWLVTDDEFDDAFQLRVYFY